jgi:hypothetical protein
MIGQCLFSRRMALATVVAIAAVGGALVAPAYTQSKERGKTMQYMVMVYENESAFQSRTGAEKEKYWGAWAAYTKALRDAGVMTSGHGLHPPTTSTTVRLRDGKRQVQDGPFADTKEQLGGYYVIEVANLDAALEWAAKCPAAAYAAVEVRPILVR